MLSSQKSPARTKAFDLILNLGIHAHLLEPMIVEDTPLVEKSETASNSYLNNEYGPSMDEQKATEPEEKQRISPAIDQFESWLLKILFEVLLLLVQVVVYRILNLICVFVVIWTLILRPGECLCIIIIYVQACLQYSMYVDCSFIDVDFICKFCFVDGGATGDCVGVSFKLSVLLCLRWRENHKEQTWRFGHKGKGVYLFIFFINLACLDYICNIVSLLFMCLWIM
jgi:hypothetical protein